MSWKSVEMQVALPRVQDAGKLQEQIAQRNPTLQHFINQKQLKAERTKRQTVNKQEDVEEALVRKDKEASGQIASSSQDQGQSETIDHPFLGKRIDFSG